VNASIADDVRRGLTSVPKTLPAYLFYDEEGSRLYERITDLPEYYLTRVEHAILVAHANYVVDRLVTRHAAPWSVIELGAGSATKTEILLRALLARQPRCLYVPIDVSTTALADAERRLRTDLPHLAVRALPTTYEQALPRLVDVSPPRLVLYLGSSVGNLADDEASALLRSVRDALNGEAWLLLGTDLRKSPSVLCAAYDDAAGVTATFNKNVLRRINRELGGHFDLDKFRHVARWNEESSRIEMHLESTSAQDIDVDALALRVRFDAGETIHTESCAKYDLPRVERLIADGGFDLDATFFDDERRFALHLARVR
jgi:dimethylhistidine N-methyltransferase